MRRIAQFAGLLVFAMLVGSLCAQRVRSMQSWVRVKDAYRVHERWVVRQADGSLTVLGEFYEVEPGDVRAQCYGQAPQGFATTLYAAEYVLGCEVWK